MGLAPIIVQEFLQIVAQPNREAGVSFLIAEQRINLALKYAPHACLLDTGRATAGPGRPAELLPGQTLNVSTP